MLDDNMTSSPGSDGSFPSCRKESFSGVLCGFVCRARVIAFRGVLVVIGVLVLCSSRNKEGSGASCWRGF